ncbi:hypothetical protein BX616_005551, partial [Lobosporangium transversale]
MATLRTPLQRTLISACHGYNRLGHPNRRFGPFLSVRPFASISSSEGFLGRQHKDQQNLVEGEPSGPKIVTSVIPGPKTRAGLQDLDKLQDTRAATMMTDLDKSIGNYVADLDGNI